MFSNSTGDSPQDAEPSGFHEFSDGLLDHLAEANERVELDLFDNREHAADQSHKADVVWASVIYDRCSPCRG